MNQPTNNLRHTYEREHKAWWDENNRDGVSYADFTESEEVWVAARWFSEKDKENGVVKREFEFCPTCAGELDTGWECNKCGLDWRDRALMSPALDIPQSGGRAQSCPECGATDTDVHGHESFCQMDNQ